MGNKNLVFIGDLNKEELLARLWNFQKLEDPGGIFSWEDHYPPKLDAIQKAIKGGYIGFFADKQLGVDLSNDYADPTEYNKEYIAESNIYSKIYDNPFLHVVTKLRNSK